MNSLELAYIMRRVSIDSRCGVPHPPETLSLSSILSTSTAESDFDLCMFDESSSPSTLYSESSQQQASQNRRNTVKGWGSAVSRGRRMSNLTSLGGGSSLDSTRSCSSSNDRTASNNEGSWGYFVDTLADWDHSSPDRKKPYVIKCYNLSM